MLALHGVQLQQRQALQLSGTHAAAWLPVLLHILCISLVLHIHVLEREKAELESHLLLSSANVKWEIEQINPVNP